MQTLEATISLLVLLLIINTYLVSEGAASDNSLYKYQLMNDAWRVLYLREDFKDLSFNSLSITRDKAEEDIEKIGELTGFCVFISGERLTNCRGEEIEEIITTQKSLFVDAKIENVAFTIAIKRQK